MSFDLVGNGSYGSGALGDVTDPDKSIINAYAAVDDIGTYDFLAIPYKNSDYVAWKSDECVGCQVLIHALACKSGATSHSLCGRYLIATITDAALEDDYSLRVTIDKSTADFQAGKNYYFWQAILIPEFKTLKLQSKSVKPLAFDFYDNLPLGGVLALKCSDTLNLAGGHVNLNDCGFPLNISTAYRPNANHETNGTLDTDLYSGSENSIAQNKLLLNAGDGACLIMAKTINCSSGSSRIGNPTTQGVQYCRGATDSVGLPANVTNVGGSTIAIVTHLFNNFTPNLIAKYRSTTDGAGRGLARAYLAVLNAHNSPKPDEGLYALDVICRDNRLKNMCNISGFGNAQDGTYNLANTTPSKCWNSYAKVTAISGRVYTISRVTASAEEFTDFAVGRLVLIHQSRKASADDWEDGRFFMSRITAVSGSTVTIKHNFSFNLSNYNVQMIVVPEFQNLTLGKEYKTALEYSRGAGGIFAIAVNGTCNLSGGSINMEGKGTKSNVVNHIHSNYSMKGALPIGQGHGSIFILARNLTLNTSTRLGATYDGSAFGGRGGAYDKSSYAKGGGFSGKPNTLGKNIKTPGYGGGGGVNSDDAEQNGGWFSNAAYLSDAAEEGTSRSGLQGAHILIVADTITGLNLSALSTGGAEGVADSAYGQQPGGCGYGGGGRAGGANTSGSAGGYRGGGAGQRYLSQEYGGGGAGGSCFVYCNNAVSQTTTNLVLS